MKVCFATLYKIHSSVSSFQQNNPWQSFWISVNTQRIRIRICQQPNLHICI